MVYQYIAYGANREIVTGKLSATSEEAATDILGYSGYQVINLKPISSFLNFDGLKARLFPVKPAEIVLFYRQLALLLESGIDIITSLELLRGQVANRTLEGALSEVIPDLRNGNQLSAALSKHPKIFAPIYCRLVQVGEQTGDMETMLRQIADYIEKEAGSSKDIKNALRYPIAVSIIAVAVIGVMITTVFPALATLYSSFGSELPLLTKVMIGIGDKFEVYGMYFLMALLAVAGIGLAYMRTENGKYRWAKLSLSLPLIGRVNQLKELAVCSRNISLLFHAGLPLTEIMPMAIRNSNNRVMNQALDDVQQDMLKGEGLSRPMGKNPIFLPMMVQMVKVGEETGKLDGALLAVAQNYEAEAEERSRVLIGLIQPTMTIVIGLVVGFIALSMVTAMYSIYGQGF